MDPSRPLPSALDAEQALLGGLIEDPEQLDDVRKLLKAEDFHQAHHQQLYTLLQAMHQANEPVDIVTVGTRLAAADEEETYGGMTYVLSLPDRCPSTRNLMHYANLVRERSSRRAYVLLARELEKAGFDESIESDKLITAASTRFADLAEADMDRDWAQVSSVTDERMVELRNRANAPSGLTGTPTGFSELNEMLTGFHPNQMLVLAARPGMGKTALALNFVWAAASDEHRLFSEDPSGRRGGKAPRRRHLQPRDGPRGAGRSAPPSRGGGRWPEDADRRAHPRRSGTSSTRPATSCTTARSSSTTPRASPSRTSARRRARLKRVHGEDLGLIVIDYLQLMHGTDPRANRQSQISEISRGLKLIAKELEVPVLALSQLNRDLEKRKLDDRKPRLSDLRESGAIEQDADVILFIHREEVHGPDDLTEGRGRPDRGQAARGANGRDRARVREALRALCGPCAQPAGRGPAGRPREDVHAVRGRLARSRPPSNVIRRCGRAVGEATGGCLFAPHPIGYGPSRL